MPTAAADQLAPAPVWLSYASPLLLRRLGGGRPVQAPDVEDLEGAVVLLDVEGFSAFAERMGARGNDGVETLATRINETFTAMVESIERYGGIAHSFPGDSVIALWPADDRSLEEATLLAARCSLELLETHRDSDLPLKAGLSAGALRIAHVGGDGGRLQLLLGGAPLDEMGRAEERSSRGRLIVADPAWRLLSAHAGETAPIDGYREIRTLRTAPPPARPSGAQGTPRDVDADALRPYLAQALVRQLDIGNAAWLGEFREVTVLFVQLRPESAPSGSIDTVQAAFLAAQRAIHRHGGDIARFAHDDKGLAVLAVFGLPPASSEDAAGRAVQAAMEIERSGPRLAFGCRIGAATGRVFCGTLGAPRRREYSVVGSTANLAARLMQSLEAGVHCDAATAQAANGSCRFENAGSLRPKGFPEAIEVFRVADDRRGERPSPAAAEALLVGRERERRRLRDWIEGVRSGSGGLALLRGEAGVGKTELARETMRRGREQGVDVVAANCDIVESTGAYAAWGRLLAPPLRVDARDADASVARLEEALASAGLQPQLAPLVGSILGVEIPDNAATREMSGTTRSDNVLALLLRLTLHAAATAREAGRPLLLVVEDAHWMDAASWELLGLLARRTGEEAPAVLLTMRSEATPCWSDWESALPPVRTERIEVAALGQAETLELCRRLLRADSLTQQLGQMVWERTHGNPFFCGQLVSALAETAIVAVETGVATLRVRNPEQAESLVPRSVAAVVTSRLDRLPAPVQLTLKTASVIGARFDLRLLQAIHPMRPDEHTLDAHVAEAVELGLLERPGAGSRLRRFQHAITRDVSYELLLASQRRQLHREIAEHLSGSDDAPAAQATLFYHWRHSGDEEKALAHVDQAGAEALREGRYHTVTELYRYALEALAARPSAERAADAPLDCRREARWSGHLGMAQVALGLHEAARSNLEYCLESLDEDVPQGTVAVFGSIAREAAQQLRHRVAPSRAIGRDASRSSRLKLAADTWEQLGYVHYSAGQTTLGLLDALRILNLAELAGDPDRMAGSYAVMSLTASVVGLRRLAALYDRRTMTLARQTDDALVRSYVGWVTGLRATGEADWPLASMRLEAAAAMADAAGDRRQKMNCLQALAWPAWTRGDARAMSELADAQLSIARESNNRLWETWALNGQAEGLAMAGVHDAVIRNCQRSLDVLSEESDRAEEIRALGLLAVALMRRSRVEEALAAARRGLDLLRGLEMTNFSMFEGIAGIAEVFAAQAEQARERSGPSASGTRKAWKQAVDALARFARTFPIGRPRLHALRARLAAIDGADAETRKHFDRALRAADDFGLPHEKALALIEAARSRVLDGPSRRRRVDEAIGLLRGGEAKKRAVELQASLAKESR